MSKDEAYDHEKVTEAIGRCSAVAEEMGLTMLECYQCFRSLAATCEGLIGLPEGSLDEHRSQGDPS